MPSRLHEPHQTLPRADRRRRGRRDRLRIESHDAIRRRHARAGRHRGSGRRHPVHWQQSHDDQRPPGNGHVPGARVGGPTLVTRAVAEGGFSLEDHSIAALPNGSSRKAAGRSSSCSKVRRRCRNRSRTSGNTHRSSTRRSGASVRGPRCTWCDQRPSDRRCSTTWWRRIRGRRRR